MAAAKHPRDYFRFHGFCLDNDHLAVDADGKPFSIQPAEVFTAKLSGSAAAAAADADNFFLRMKPSGLFQIYDNADGSSSIWCNGCAKSIALSAGPSVS